MASVTQRSCRVTANVSSATHNQYLHLEVPLFPCHIDSTHVSMIVSWCHQSMGEHDSQSNGNTLLIWIDRYCPAASRCLMKRQSARYRIETHRSSSCRFSIPRAPRPVRVLPSQDESRPAATDVLSQHGWVCFSSSFGVLLDIHPAFHSMLVLWFAA